MLARGSLGNPWLFEQLLGRRGDGAGPTGAEVLAELDWLMDRAVEHMGPVRGARWLRKAYPWYVDRLGGGKELQAALQATESVEAARAALAPERDRHPVGDGVAGGVDGPDLHGQLRRARAA
jgi:tRNA-dihydrouridine synthase